MITAEGIVLRERSVGEQDKFIDILTKESGVLELAVKGAKRINGKSGSSTQLFAYSRFCMNERRNQLYLNSAEPIHIFYGLRSSLTAVSLASYFADVIKYCIQERQNNENILRLMLNTLYFLEKNARSEELLKSIFELRLSSEIGFMPDIVMCRGCGCYEPEEALLSVDDGSFLCAECAAHGGTAAVDGCFRVKTAVIRAIRHIVLADFSRLFNFRISDAVQSVLSEFSELYLLNHLERGFNTLDFYNQLRQQNNLGKLL